ncbi:MAG TPA: cytochrome c, partial [Vicinamibacterales bacterium]
GVAAGLAAALLLAGGATAMAQRPDAVTFNRDVAPILYANCVSCHRAGEVGPMPLVSYTDVRPWASAIKQKVVSRAMPPWGADRAHGTFSNDLSMDDEKIRTIAAWVDAGAPEGTSALPPRPRFADGWQIGQPDQVFEMRADFEVPARGAVDYQYFEVPTNFTEDRWMQAGEVRAGDRAHVHHIIVYIKEPQSIPGVVSVRPILQPGAEAPRSPARPAPQAGQPAPAQVLPAASRGGDNMLVNWAVGEDAPVFQPGMAKRIPAGSTLVFQVHYTTNGTPGRDRSRLGLVFAEQPPTREVRTGLIANPMLAIPPGAADHLVEAEGTFSEDVKVWSLHPHMHLRGKDMTYTITYPDGRQEVALRVPKFDFGWQTDYHLAAPLTLPKGSKVRVTAHFDNSAANRANPDPTTTVRWGDQTWEEMMIGFFTYTVEGRAPRTASR